MTDPTRPPVRQWRTAERLIALMPCSVPLFAVYADDAETMIVQTIVAFGIYAEWDRRLPEPDGPMPADADRSARALVVGDGAYLEPADDPDNFVCLVEAADRNAPWLADTIRAWKTRRRPTPTPTTT